MVRLLTSVATPDEIGGPAKSEGRDRTRGGLVVHEEEDAWAESATKQSRNAHTKSGRKRGDRTVPMNGIGSKRFGKRKRQAERNLASRYRPVARSKPPGR